MHLYVTASFQRARSDLAPSSETISQDKAAVLAYLRLKHKDPYKGYILCGIVSTHTPLVTYPYPGSQSRTVVHNVLVGSVSFASPGPKALHNASTAQEIEVVTPSASGFEFRVGNLNLSL
jgi:hypothetical protein